MTWTHVPGTDSPSAQAALDWIWASCSPSPAITPAASSSGSPIPGPSCRPECAPDTSPTRRSGTTSPPLTADPSEAPSTRSSPDTPASPSARPASAAASPTSATCGPTSPGSSERSRPSGCCSRTSPATSPSAPRPCCEPYATWAGRLRWAYSQRLKSARRTSGSGGSAWPTATTEKGLYNRAGLTPTSGDGLATAADRWSTPTALAPAKNGYSAAGNSDGLRAIQRQAEDAGLWSRTWPTPAARADTQGDADIPAIARRLELGKQIHLAHRARLFSRPAQATPPAGSTPSMWRPIARRLLRSAMWPAGPVTRRRWLRKGVWRRRRLNPLFVEWLMGWPAGHALCACSGTAWSRYARRMRGALSQLPTASGPWIWTPPTTEAPESPHQMEMF